MNESLSATQEIAQLQAQVEALLRGWAHTIDVLKDTRQALYLACEPAISQRGTVDIAIAEEKAATDFLTRNVWQRAETPINQAKGKVGE